MGEHHSWINSAQADVFFGALIIFNAVVVGIQVQLQISDIRGWTVFFWMHFILTLVFVVEVALRLMANGKAFIQNPLELSDLVVVTTSLVEVSIALNNGHTDACSFSTWRMLRLLMTSRLLRLLHIWPQLLLLMTSLATSIKAIFWAFFLLAVVWYLCSLFLTLLLGTSNNPALRESFGRIGRSVYTHFVIQTLEAFPSLARDAAEESWLWYLYFVAFIMFSTMVLVNLIVAVIVERVVTHGNRVRSEARASAQDYAKFQEVLSFVLELNGYPTGEQEMSVETLGEVLRDPVTRTILDAFDVSVELEEHRVLAIIGGSDVATAAAAAADSMAACCAGVAPGAATVCVGTPVTSREISAGLPRLRGSRGNTHSALTQCDLARAGKSLSRRLREDKSCVVSYMDELFEAFDRRLIQEFHRIDWLPAATEQKVASSKAPAFAKRLRELAVASEACVEESRRALAQLNEDLVASRKRVRGLQSELRKQCLATSDFQDTAPRGVAETCEHVDAQRLIDEFIAAGWSPPRLGWTPPGTPRGACRPRSRRRQRKHDEASRRFEEMFHDHPSATGRRLALAATRPPSSAEASSPSDVEGRCHTGGEATI
eukprot:NODE_3870_length_1970_cov_10.243082.p1 GENE.NODE_3870_length_1970_cov_10.243082~~NODE_3870_length_1970_cov_10.243082.p1  ORF type:complete len:601 (-),score=132.93 NODE_3870_length_1970_cov_10.243082:166-1968(-)